MTRDEMIAEALASYDRHANDATRKLTTDLLVAGHDDDDIEAVLAVGREMQAEDQPALIEWLERSTDEAVAWLQSQQDSEGRHASRVHPAGNLAGYRGRAGMAWQVSTSLRRSLTSGVLEHPARPKHTSARQRRRAYY